MEKPKYKIIGTNAMLKAFLYDCILEGIPVSRANSFFRDDYEHCLMPAYPYDGHTDKDVLELLKSLF